MSRRRSGAVAFARRSSGDGDGATGGTGRCAQQPLLAFRALPDKLGVLIDRAPSFADAGAPGHITAGLAKLGLVLRHEAWQGRERTGLTPTQSQILALLRRGPRRLGDLADELAVSAATASDSLRVLTEKGLAVKERSPADGRSLAAHLRRPGARPPTERGSGPIFSSRPSMCSTPRSSTCSSARSRR